MPIFRYPHQIKVVDLTKGYKEPKTEAQNSKDRMMTGDGLSPMPTRPDQASAGGVKCGRCGHHHSPGNICSFNKSSLEGLLDFISKAADIGAITQVAKKKYSTDAVKEAAEATSTGIKGHKGGNPYHDEQGRFTTKDGASSKTTSAGAGAVSVSKDNPKAGSGRGSDSAEKKTDVTFTNNDRESDSVEGLFDEGSNASSTAAGSAAAAKKKGAEVSGKEETPQESDQKAAWEQKKQEVIGDIEAAKELGIEPKMVRDQALAELQQAGQQISPEKYGRRTKEPFPGAPSSPSQEELLTHDPHTEAAKTANLEAQRAAAQRVREAGGDQVAQAEAGQQAWKLSNDAFNEAREQGISPNQVSGREQELADAWRQRQGIEGVMPQPEGAQTQVAPSPFAQTEVQPSSDTMIEAVPAGAAQDQSKTYVEKPTDMYDPTKTYVEGPPDMSASEKPPSQYDKLQQRKKYDKTYNEARKHGFSHEDAHAAAAEYSGANWEAGPDTWEPGGKGKGKQGIQIPGAKTGVTGQEPKKEGLNVPFGQLYSQGQAIGSGLGTPGGTVGATGGLAAQRAHSLLNPHIRPKPSQRLPHMGTTDERRTVGTRDVSRTSMDKSLEGLFDL